MSLILNYLFDEHFSIETSIICGRGCSKNTGVKLQEWGKLCCCLLCEMTHYFSQQAALSTTPKSTRDLHLLFKITTILTKYNFDKKFGHFFVVVPYCNWGEEPYKVLSKSLVAKLAICGTL